MPWFWICVFAFILTFIFDYLGFFKGEDRSNDLEQARRAYRDRRKRENRVSFWERIYRKFY